MHPSIRRAGRFVTAHLDQPLLGATLLLMAAGLVVLYSASNASMVRVSGQVTNMLVALGETDPSSGQASIAGAPDALARSTAASMSTVMTPRRRTPLRM